MNTIRDDFPEDVKIFFKRLENYLDTDLYFYGSVNRSDYIHGKSDIDIAIFTDNEYSVMNKLQHFLHVKRNAFDKVVWKLYGEMLYGYKIKCDKYIDLKCEIAIYNNDFKNTLLNEYRNYNHIPLYISILLFILKTLHYTFPLLSEKNYSAYKRYLFNKVMLNKQNTVFFLLKQNR
jgi:predicted nucleotidyltransferase